ncbi:hypothetical protein EYF80_045960 [Liparis tanakae]|uniref:Uncharacterized protein n=1 Tax=Liparis tanakae TaxID=230148 RepID=A0A4Z2FRJ9_9TELE|nr:hypothetical protein EYF80_045960 [Liparis tanakae]
MKLVYEVLKSAERERQCYAAAAPPGSEWLSCSGEHREDITTPMDTTRPWCIQELLRSSDVRLRLLRGPEGDMVVTRGLDVSDWGWDYLCG